MASLIIISGPQAVGKMTVAEELQKHNGYRLMTNHFSIEQSFRSDGSLDKEKRDAIRMQVFKECINTNTNLIFTFVVAYDYESDISYVNMLKDMFEKSGGSFYFVELSASLEERLKRNVTENRLAKKASKNNIERSTKDLINTAQNHKLNTIEGEKVFKNHIKIDNTYLSPEEAANIILDEIQNLNKKQSKDDSDENTIKISNN